MITARRVSQSIRSWSYLGAMTLFAGLTVAACGGKVVVDGDGNSSGDGGAGGTTVSSAAVTPSTGSSSNTVCDAAIDHLQSCVSMMVEVPPLPPCEGMVLCQFTCILLASCGGLIGTDQAEVEKLGACIMACG